MPEENIIDELGDLKHEIDVLTERYNALKDQVKAQGYGKFASDNYVVTVSSRRNRLDEVAFSREFDPESFPELWTSKPVVNAEAVKFNLSPAELDKFYVFADIVTIKEVG